MLFVNFTKIYISGSQQTLICLLWTLLNITDKIFVLVHACYLGWRKGISRIYHFLRLNVSSKIQNIINYWVFGGGQLYHILHSVPWDLDKIRWLHLQNKNAGFIYELYRENTWQNLYHTPYQPKTPISARGLILVEGLHGVWERFRHVLLCLLYIWIF